MKTQQGEVRITAPLLTEMIGPNGRALRAVAAAGFVESGTPLEPAAIRGLAHVLSRQMSLAFIGPEGEVSDELPVLRKLALPEMLSPEKTGLPPQPVALEPFDYGPPEPEPGPLLPRRVDDQHTPGARDAGSRVPAWPLLAAGGLLAIFGVFQLIDYPLPYRLLAILAVVALVATALFPRDESPGRRRLPWLLVLAAPWLIALAAGPLADDVTYGGGAPAPAWMIPTQFALLIASAVLPLGLLPYMRGARRFTIALGVFHLVLTAFVTVSGVLLLSGAD